MNHKTLSIEIVKQDDTGGEITINTASVDRDRDRVMPAGANLESYLKNPVVQWGHNYRDPWATIGKTTELTVNEAGINAKFELRDPVNEADPMHIIKALWDNGLVKTASIGFNPIEGKENDFGGNDFTEWELLEWSLVPIPANQDALRLAVKGLSDMPLIVLDETTTTTLDVIEPADNQPDNSKLFREVSAFVDAIKQELRNE